MFRHWLMAGLLLPGVVFAADAPTTPPDLPPGAGLEQVQANCGGCHSVKVVVGHHYDAAHWRQIVVQMVDKGAMIADSDYDAIVGYLTKFFGPA